MLNQARFVFFLLCFLSGQFFFCAAEAKAENYRHYNGVGFASMELFSFGEKVWDNNFSILAKQSYWMKYSSFRQVSEKLQIGNLKPMGLKINDHDKVMPYNAHSVRLFHEKFNRRGDAALRNLALANRTMLIVFDYVEKFHVEQFIDNKTDNFTVFLMVYYLDSNALGMNYIPVNRKEFSEKHIDFDGLKSKIHSAVLAALEEAVVNTAGIVSQIAREHETESRFERRGGNGVDANRREQNDFWN